MNEGVRACKFHTASTIHSGCQTHRKDYSSVADCEFDRSS